MMTRIKSRVKGVALIVVFALSAAVAGCGSDESTRSEDHGVVTMKESGAASNVRPATGSATTPVSIEPEVVVAAVPEQTKEVTYEEAEAAFHEKSYDRAVELFTLYTDRKSENPWGFYMLGLSAWKAGDHESAEEAFKQALELDKLHTKSWINLSRVLLDTGRPEEALAGIDKALAIDPESNVAYRLRGRAFHQLGRMEEAVGAYRRAIRIDDRDAWSMNNLGLIFIEQRSFDEALPPLARAIELVSAIATFQNNMGMALEHTGHFRAAEEAYNSAITIDESYEKAYANLDRVENVIEDPGLEPVDLAVIAKIFIDEIEIWKIAAAAVIGLPEHLETESDSIVISDAGIGNAVVGDADSTGNRQQ